MERGGLVGWVVIGTRGKAGSQDLRSLQRDVDVLLFWALPTGESQPHQPAATRRAASRPLYSSAAPKETVPHGRGEHACTSWLAEHLGDLRSGSFAHRLGR
eukprot:353827-Chlamydomonas_euryale.AAC.6